MSLSGKDLAYHVQGTGVNPQYYGVGQGEMPQEMLRIITRNVLKINFLRNKMLMEEL